MNNTIQADPDSWSGSVFEKSEKLRRLSKVRDPDEWKKFVDLYTPLIGHWISRWRLQASDVDNLRQEVFQRLTTTLAQFSGQTGTGSFRAWLRTITENIVRDHFRRLGLKERFNDPTGGSKFLARLNQIPGQEPSLGGIFDSVSNEDRGENILLFNRIMAWVKVNLPEEKAGVFCSLTMHGADAAEVARQFSISRGQAYQIKSRILAKIREEFSDLI